MTASERSTYPERFLWLDAVHRCSCMRPKTKNYAWALNSHADKRTLFCFPNLAQLNADLGGKETSKNVSSHIAALRNAGFIQIGFKTVHGRKSNNYTLVFPPPECGRDHASSSDFYANLRGKHSDHDQEVIDHEN